MRQRARYMEALFHSMRATLLSARVVMAAMILCMAFTSPSAAEPKNLKGVALGGTNGPMLDVGDGLAPVALSAVQQVF